MIRLQHNFPIIPRSKAAFHSQLLRANKRYPARSSELSLVKRPLDWDGGLDRARSPGCEGKMVKR
jgi:hypothetical protein